VGCFLIGSAAASIWDAQRLQLLSAGLFAAFVALVPSLARGRLLRREALRDLMRPITWCAVLVIWITAINLRYESSRVTVVAAALSSLGMLMLAATILWTGRKIHPVSSARLLGLYGGITLTVGYLIGEVWAPCRADKCSVGGQLLRSVYGSENSVSFWAALALCYEIAGGQRSLRVIRAIILVLVLLLSGGRGAILSLLLAVAVAVFIGRFLSGRSGQYRVSLRNATLFAAATSAVAIAVAAVSQRSSFTGRGRLWGLALENVSLISPIGVGTVDWDRLTELDPVPLSVHSSYLWMLFGEGLVAVALYVAVLATLWAREGFASRRGFVANSIPVLYVLTIGVTGVVWNPATLDEFSVLWLIILVSVQGPNVIPGLAADSGFSKDACNEQGVHAG